MKKLALIASLTLLLNMPTTASAEVENWYTYWAIGGASNDYPGEVNSLIDLFDSLPGVDRTQTALDMLGFYWPYNNKTMMGFVISGTADRLENPYYYIQANQYLYGFSTMHFFGREIGDGFYVRGDIGFSKMVLSSNFGSDIQSDTGSGIALGFGYAWAVSEQSRVLFGFRLSNNNIEGENYSSTAFTIGGLW